MHCIVAKTSVIVTFSVREVILLMMIHPPNHTGLFWEGLSSTKKPKNLGESRCVNVHYVPEYRDANIFWTQILRSMKWLMVWLHIIRGALGGGGGGDLFPLPQPSPPPPEIPQQLFCPPPPLVQNSKCTTEPKIPRDLCDLETEVVVSWAQRVCYLGPEGF